MVSITQVINKNKNPRDYSFGFSLSAIEPKINKVNNVPHINKTAIVIINPPQSFKTIYTESNC